MKKVCILTSVHSPFDGRIFYKESKSLSKAGYEVIIIAQHDKEEFVDNIKIIPLPVLKNRTHRMTKIVGKLFRLALKEKADVYHFHDPELIPIGILLRLYGKRVIYDVHEDVSKQVLNKDWVGNVNIRKFVAFIVNIIEQIGALLFNRIVVATPDIARKFPENKTLILRNFTIFKLIDNTVPANYRKNKPIIIYAGGLTKIRGIKEIIQAMEYIGDRAELWLLGKWENEEFRKECKNLKGWKCVKDLGFVSLNKVYQYMKISDIGISMFHPVKNYLIGLPVKAFEYMACSMPLVMSGFPYFKKFFRECAIFANPFDFRDIVEKLLYLLDNPDKAKELGKMGRKLVEDKYSWEEESKKLLRMYEKL